jgi:hypothetical protein
VGEVQEAQLEARLARVINKMKELNASYADEEIEADLREAEKEIRKP